VADVEWLAVGLIIGLLVGIPLGWVMAQVARPQPPPAQPASVVFERDEKGRVTGIHYVPAK